MDFQLSEEQQDIQRTVRRLAREKVAPRAAEIDRTGEFPWDLRGLFAEHGLLALAVPPEYGGIDGTIFTFSLAMEEVARVCGSTAMMLGNQSLGSSPLVLWGDAQQKTRYLPGIAEGSIMPAFALTEPNAGSDVRALQTRARPEAGGWVLNGTKHFITQGNLADLLTVFARVPGEAGDGISAFLVEKGTEGLKYGRVEQKMGMRGSPTAEIFLDNVWVPRENLLGPPGGGYRIALDCLTKGRIMVAALGVGIAQGALDVATDYARNRVQFGRPIAELQAVQFMLADMETHIEAARALYYLAAYKYDTRQGDPVKLSAAAKLFATDMAMRVTTDAVQVLGGYGYCLEYPVERMMRDAKVLAIFEGTNQIQRLVVARRVLAGRGG